MPNPTKAAALADRMSDLLSRVARFDLNPGSLEFTDAVEEWLPAARDELRRLDALVVAIEATDGAEYDKDYDRHYLPLPGGWEVHTKGKGSTFRIVSPGGDRLGVPDNPYLHETLEQMARDIRAALGLSARVLTMSSDSPVAPVQSGPLTDIHGPIAGDA